MINILQIWLEGVQPLYNIYCEIIADEFNKLLRVEHPLFK